MRAVIYARVSTADQDCLMQLTALREYIAARGWVMISEHVDSGISGAKKDRPALNELMRLARLRSIDVVLVWKLDRFGRSVKHLVELTQELDSLGVRFISITQGIDTDQSNPTSRLMLNLLSCFAEFEREMIRERVIAGIARAKDQGKQFGRKRKVFRQDQVLAMKAAGNSISEIESVMGLSRGLVQRTLNGKLPPRAQ